MSVGRARDPGRVPAGGRGHGYQLHYRQDTAQPGFLRLLAGDIPAALQLFDAAADGYRLDAPGFLPCSGHGQGPRAAGGRPAQRRGQRAGPGDGVVPSAAVDHHLAEAQPARPGRALAAGQPASAGAGAGCRTAIPAARQRGVGLPGGAYRGDRHGRSQAGCRAFITAEALWLALLVRTAGWPMTWTWRTHSLHGGCWRPGGGRSQAADRAWIPPWADGAAERQAASATGLVELVERDGWPGWHWPSSGRAWPW